MKKTKKKMDTLRRRCEALAAEAQGCARAVRKLQKRLALDAHGRDVLRNQIRLLERDANGMLTLHELCGMVGEPVWVVDLVLSESSGYHFVERIDGAPVLVDVSCFLRGNRPTLRRGLGVHCGHDVSWVAYRRRPEEEGK